METMGDRIRQLRESRGWTQQELAERLSVSLRAHGKDPVTSVSVSQWERSETKNIKNVTFYLLARELGTQEEYLLFGPRGPRRRQAQEDRRGDTSTGTERMD